MASVLVYYAVFDQKHYNAEPLESLDMLGDECRCDEIHCVQVYGLPTIILFKDGTMVKGSLNEGAITKPMLLKYLEKHGIGKVAAKN